MTRRTIAVGDIHGDLVHLDALLSILPPLAEDDTLVFLGDYLDRGPNSAGVVARLQALPERTPAQIITLKGNHEDAWLKVMDGQLKEFVLPISNGCLATYRSFTGGPVPTDGELGGKEEILSMTHADFFPEAVVEWMRSLPEFYEDEHAVYVHAGLPRQGGRFVHPAELADPRALFWERSEEFYTEYRGKRVVFGHTMVSLSPQDRSTPPPEDEPDVFFGEHVIGVDTHAGHGGFLSAVELPGLVIYESRSVVGKRG